MRETLHKFKATLIKRVGFAIIKGLEFIIAKFSAVPTTPFLNPDEFLWTKTLETNWRSIRRELDDILKYREQLPNFQDVSKDQVAITKDDHWKTFFLYAFGHRSKANCSKCPETDRLLQQIPGMKTAFFSILSPGKHIPSHRGPYKGVIRYHLGLLVPEPKEKCRIRVHEEFRHWQEGQSLLFDDTYQHEVWNETSGHRVVLFVDVERPMRFPGSWFNKAIIYLISISPFITDSAKNEINWEKQFEKFLRDEADKRKTA